MKRIANIAKKAAKWYFTQYANAYGENYFKYGYKYY
jgi:hypothetical protein